MATIAAQPNTARYNELVAAQLEQPQQIALNFDALAANADGDDFSITIKRSPRRRTMEIIVRSGGVNLMLPSFVSEAEGLAFLESKRSWVVRTLAKQDQLESEKPHKTYRDGEEFSLLGKPFRLRIYIAAKPGAQFRNEELFVGIRGRHRTSKSEAVKKQVWAWYQQQALDILQTKTHAMAQEIGRTVTAVTLRRTKTKWGHCTRDGVIQYNWQIITAPEKVVDYLVAHEVSHLVHLNHGKRFWRKVESLCPNYLTEEKWLKDNGHKIGL